MASGANAYYVCRRALWPNGHSWAMSYPETLLSVQSPFNLSISAAANAFTFVNVSLTDHVLRNVSLEFATMNAPVFVRDNAINPLTLNIDDTMHNVAVNDLNFTVMLDAVHAGWLSTKPVYWYTMPATGNETGFFTGDSDDGTHSPIDVMMSTELGPREMWVQLYTGVSTISSPKYEVIVVCNPLTHKIAQAYFSYGDTNENGTMDETVWTAANWQPDWVESGNKTIRSNSFGYFYIATQYKELSGACSNWWLQYDNLELFISTTPMTEADAIADCAAREALMLNDLMNAAIPQNFQVG